MTPTPSTLARFVAARTRAAALSAEAATLTGTARHTRLDCRNDALLEAQMIARAAGFRRVGDMIEWIDAHEEEAMNDENEIHILDGEIAVRLRGAGWGITIANHWNDGERTQMATPTTPGASFVMLDADGALALADYLEAHREVLKMIADMEEA